MAPRSSRGGCVLHHLQVFMQYMSTWSYHYLHCQVLFVNISNQQPQLLLQLIITAKVCFGGENRCCYVSSIYRVWNLQFRVLSNTIVSYLTIPNRPTRCKFQKISKWSCLNVSAYGVRGRVLMVVMGIGVGSCTTKYSEKDFLFAYSDTFAVRSTL